MYIVGNPFIPHIAIRIGTVIRYVRNTMAWLGVVVVAFSIS